MSKEDRSADNPSGRWFPENLAGYFLISSTDLNDPNFYRTVVLIVEHNSDGAFGLVVNRQSDVRLGTLLNELENSAAQDILVQIGGPLQQEYLFVLHAELPGYLTSEHATRPAEGVVFEPATEPLVEYLGSAWAGLPAVQRPPLRIYAGYSGWGPGQLETELQQDAWFVHPASAGIVFHPNPDAGWKDALGEKGAFYRIVADTGYMPSMN